MKKLRSYTLSLVALYIATFLLRSSFSATLLVFGRYLNVIGKDPLEIAFIDISYSISEMITAAYFGVLADRVGRKPVMLYGTLLAGITVAIIPISNSTIWLLSIHAIVGLGAAAKVSSTLALISDYASPEQRGKLMGFYDYSTISGYIAGFLYGGFFYDYFDVSNNLSNIVQCFLSISMPLFIAAITILIFVIEYEARRERKETEIESISSIKDLKIVWQNEKLRNLLPLWLCITTLFGMASTFGPVISEEAGVSGLQTGLLFAAAGTAFGLLQPIWGHISDKIGRTKVLIIGVVSLTGLITLIPIIFMVFPNIKSLMDIPIPILALIGMLVIGIGALPPAALASVVDETPEDKRGPVMGVYSMMLGLGDTLGGLVGGLFVKAFDWIGLIYFAGLLVIIAVISTSKYTIKSLMRKIK